MTFSNSDPTRERKASSAAIFVDYENIHLTLDETPGVRGEPGELISQMIEALQKGLRQERDARTAVSRAYADFTALDGKGDTIQRLYLQGVEPRFVPCTLQSNAVEIQLCIDAMDLLYHRQDIETFVLLTGRRTYLPLVQHVKRYGRSVLVVALEEPTAFEQVQHMEGEWFFDARDLLGASARADLGAATVRRGPTSANRPGGTSNLDRERRGNAAGRDLRGAPSGNGSELRRAARHYENVDDDVLMHALQIIDEHFGQYDEVYLTPLLRKMSEMLDDDDCDPKAIVSDLEECGAVRLEKRQGFPHDYTVLIVDRSHPDVVQIQTEAKDRSEFDYEEDRDDYYPGRFSVDGEDDYYDEEDDDVGTEDDGDYSAAYDDSDEDLRTLEANDEIAQSRPPLP